MAHDFFTEQPVKEANFYLLRQILHDWSDKYAVKILRSLLSAMGKDSAIIVMEQVLPDPGDVPLPVEYYTR